MDCATTQSEGQHTALGTLLVHDTMPTFSTADGLPRLDLVFCSAVYSDAFVGRSRNAMSDSILTCAKIFHRMRLSHRISTPCHVIAVAVARVL